MANLNIDDGGGPGFSSGYDDVKAFTLSDVQVPDIVGCWRISGNFHVHASKRPNWLHRRMAKLLLGWEWKGL
jgi:hypothetical protein